MKFVASIVSAAIIFSVATSCQKKVSINNHILWYEYPGKYWNSQGLHLGNGYFGSSYLGG